jgi:hypothetical protein
MNKLNDDLKQAMKDKDKNRKNVITMIKAAVKNKSIDLKRDLTDEEIIEIVAKQSKQTREVFLEFISAKRFDLATQAEDEIKILDNYLPKQLTEEELNVIVSEIVKNMTDGARNIGNVMKELAPKVKGKADGKLVNQIVKKELEGR